MDIIFLLVSISLAFWAIRSICTKKQSGIKKFLKSLFAIWYFLSSAGIGIQNHESALFSIIMMAVGIFFVLRSNRTYKKPETTSTNIINEHADALREFNSSDTNRKFDIKRSTNYAKGKGAELTSVAFHYINGKGESTFRDVDVKKFDGEYIQGYCHLSKAFKTFRLDRVKDDIILRDTGEVINAYQWAELVKNEATI